MYHAGNFTAVFRLDRHDKPAVPHGDDRILQIFLIGRGADHLIHLFADFQFSHPNFAPDGSEFRGSVVVQRILADDSRRDFPFKRVVQVQPGELFGYRVFFLVPLVVPLVEDTGLPQDGGDGQQVAA